MVDRTVRVDDQSAIGGAPYIEDTHNFIDLNLGDDSGAAGHVLVTGEADAAAMACADRLTRAPVAHLRHALDAGSGTRIRQNR